MIDHGNTYSQATEPYTNNSVPKNSNDTIFQNSTLSRSELGS